MTDELQNTAKKKCFMEELVMLYLLNFYYNSLILPKVLMQQRIELHVMFLGTHFHCITLCMYPICFLSKLFIYYFM